jgi:hypothetical protein
MARTSNLHPEERSYSYLLPTLSVHGPQHFIIFRSSNDGEARRLPTRTKSSLGDTILLSFQSLEHSILQLKDG